MQIAELGAAGCGNSTFVAAGISRFEVTEKRKPFDFWVERLHLKKNRDECASFEPTAELVADYVAASLEPNRFDIPLLLRATRCAVT
jgi:hypothetical protein